MLLSVHDRLVLLSVVKLAAPEGGNIITMRIVHDLLMELSFTEGEKEEKQIDVDESGRATWNEATPKDIYIGDVAKDIIQKGLSMAMPIWDKAEEVTLQHISLCDRFEVDTESLVIQAEEVTEA